MAEDSEQQSNFSDQQDGRFPNVEVAVMSEGLDEFRSQEQFGHVYDAKEFVIAQALTLNPDSLVSSVGHVTSFIGAVVFVGPLYDGLSGPEHIYATL